MKRISLGLLAALLLMTAGLGLAAGGERVVEGINDKTVTLDIEGDQLVWADETLQAIGSYNFAEGRMRTVALKTAPRSVRVAEGMIFFLGGAQPGDAGLYPYYCDSRSAKTHRLDTTPANGLEAGGGYIVWYNRDRVILHNLRTGKRLTFKADQSIRDAAVSQDTLVYIDGQDAQKNYLYIVDLRTGEKKAYAFMNIGDLALSYPLVALASADEAAGTDGKAVYIVNLETEHVTTIDRTNYPALLRSDSRYGLDMAQGAVTFRSTPYTAKSAGAQGVYLYDLNKNKLMNLSPFGIRPALSDDRVAWIENGGIYVYKYR